MTEPAFDDIMGKIHEGIQQSVAADADSSPSEPVVEAAPEPEADPVVEQESATDAGETQAPATTNNAPAFDAQQAALQQMTALQQQNELLAQLLQRAIPPPKTEEKTEEPRRPPTTEEALEDFRAPQRTAAMSDEDYARKLQAAVLDHVQGKRDAFYRDEAQRTARQAVEEYRAQVASEQRRQQAEHRYVETLNTSVQAAGYKPGSPQYEFVRQKLHAELAAATAAGVTRSWSEQQWRAAMAQGARSYSKWIPSPAGGGAQPLQVVQGGKPAQAAKPPISGGGAAAVPDRPPQAKPGRAASFDEAMEQVFGAMKKEMARG
jgi:hypothetical protein